MLLKLVFLFGPPSRYLYLIYILHMMHSRHPFFIEFCGEIQSHHFSLIDLSLPILLYFSITPTAYLLRLQKVFNSLLLCIILGLVRFFVLMYISGYHFWYTAIVISTYSLGSGAMQYEFPIGIVGAFDMMLGDSVMVGAMVAKITQTFNLRLSFFLAPILLACMISSIFLQHILSDSQKYLPKNSSPIVSKSTAVKYAVIEIGFLLVVGMIEVINIDNVPNRFIAWLYGVVPMLVGAIYYHQSAWLGLVLWESGTLIHLGYLLSNMINNS